MLGVKPDRSAEAKITALVHFINMLEGEPLAYGIGVRNVRLDRVEYGADFNVFGGPGGTKNLPSIARGHVWWSVDGETWSHLLSSPLVKNGRFARRIPYRRALPTYLRQCAVTEL